jgi:hypothetical protein
MARAFYVIIVDHDLKVCSIHGPLTDDTAWGVAVVDARRKGRSVQLAGGLELTSRSLAEAEACAAYRGYRLVRSAIGTNAVRKL